MALVKPLWLSTWPLCTLLVFAGLPVVRLLAVGYVRTALTMPILFLVPGSLTLGAIFSQRRRPRGLIFACYSVLLGVVWSGLASLALYADGILIRASSTYWCLLTVSGALAIVAEARLLLDRPGKGRRVARKPETPDPDQSDDEIQDATMPAAARGAGFYSAIAVVVGVSLLGGGLYAHDHLPHPAPVGYTWMAWTNPPANGEVAIAAAGTELGFQIVHHQPETASFRLIAEWLGNSSRPMAEPLTVSVGSNKTFRGSLFVPPLPNGCTYRIAVSLTALGKVDPLTGKPQTWTINTDVHDPAKSSRSCKE
jgi:hypothetical protein